MADCEQKLVEPDVYIEYQRASLSRDNFARQSFADAIHRYNLMPDGCIVNSYVDTKTNEWVWVYKM